MMFFIGLVVCFTSFVTGNPVPLNRNGNPIEEISHYPYQAAIVYNFSSLVLPGAIVHERYIITSGLFPMLETSKVNAIVGVSEIYNGKECLAVEKVIINPNFSFGTDFNVALLKLKEPIQFSKNVKKVAIASSSPRDSKAVLTKWIGSSNSNGLKTYVLGKSEFNVLSKELCKSFYYSSAVSDTSVCGHNVNIESKDSGAPVVQNGKLVGLFQGTPLAPYYCKESTNCPSIFTDLSTVKSWVDEVIGDD